MNNKELSDHLKLENKVLSIRRTKDKHPAHDDKKGCNLRLLNNVMSGETITITQNSTSCRGANNGFGFIDGLPDIPGGFGNFITKGKGEGFPPGERIKCSIAVAEQMILTQPTNVMEDFTAIEVKLFDEDSPSDLVAILVNPDQLSALVHLFNYRKHEYDQVIMPMSSGCASLFRIPFGELLSGRRRAVIGNADIFSRPHFEKDTVFFVIDREIYEEMLEDADESFLISPIWNGVKKRL